MTHAPKSTAAFDELIDLLVEIRDDYVLAPERFTDELDVVEGYRYVTQLLSEASELLVEADPERPRFSSIVSPARKFLGDNPDALYQQAVIRGDRSYRVTGRRDEQTYISFTVHGPDPDGGINGPVLADLNDRDFDDRRRRDVRARSSAPTSTRATGSSSSPTPGCVIVRNYYLQRAVGPDRSRRRGAARTSSRSTIPGPPPPLDDATLARRLRDASAFLHATTIGLRVFGGRLHPVPFVSNEPNTVGTPWSFRNAERRRRGRGRHLLLVGQLRPRARRSARDGGHAARVRVRQRDAVERAHADARVPVTAAGR